MSSKEVYTPEMSIKEEPRSLRAVDLVVQRDNINLLKLVLPDGNYRLQVIKTEGDYLNSLDRNSRLPKGYALVRIFTESELDKVFLVNLDKLEQEESNKPVSYSSGNISQGNPVANFILERTQTKVGTKANSATFQQESQEQPENFKRKNYREKIHIHQSALETDKGDSLGYFKALNLKAEELAGLAEEEASKKIKSNYRSAAFEAHPDHGGSHDAMVKINKAMEVISSPSLRSAYQSQTGPFAPKI